MLKESPDRIPERIFERTLEESQKKFHEKSLKKILEGIIGGIPRGTNVGNLAELANIIPEKPRDYLAKMSDAISRMFPDGHTKNECSRMNFIYNS